MMLLMNSLTKREIRSRGVPVLDLYLAQQAQLMAKATGAIERVSEQCDPLNSLNLTQVIYYRETVFSGIWNRRAEE